MNYPNIAEAEKKGECAFNMKQQYPFKIRFYLWSRKKLSQLVDLLQGSFDGFWLGVLDRDTMALLDEYDYNSCKEYHDDAYNRSGLFIWEEDVIKTYFNRCGRLLVGGAGGGREVLALCKLGYEVEGFECNPELVTFANRLLREENFPSEVHLVPRDECPDGGQMYDGLIVGWGAYNHIQGREKRIAFLKRLRAKVPPGVPLLVSFWIRHRPVQRRLTVTNRVGKVLWWLLRRNRIIFGDSFRPPNYIHYFSRGEISLELRQADFELIFYDGWYGHEYGHAVALASEPVSLEPNESTCRSKT